MIELRVLIKPISVNDAWQGRRFKTPECKKYCEDLALILPRKECVTGRVQIEFKFYAKNHASVDYDNLIKVTQDVLVKKGYIEDDRKIYRAIIEKIPSKEDFFEFKITKINGENSNGSN